MNLFELKRESDVYFFVQIIIRIFIDSQIQQIYSNQRFKIWIICMGNYFKIAQNLSMSESDDVISIKNISPSAAAASVPPDASANQEPSNSSEEN